MHAQRLLNLLIMIDRKSPIAISRASVIPTYASGANSSDDFPPKNAVVTFTKPIP